MICLKIRNKQIGKRLQAYRLQAELTQEQVAEKIGKNPKSYSMIENGDRGMSIETLTQLKDVLHFNADYLLFGEITGEDNNPIVTLMNQFDRDQREYAEDLLRLLYKASHRDLDKSCDE